MIRVAAHNEPEPMDETVNVAKDRKMLPYKHRAIRKTYGFDEQPTHTMSHKYDCPLFLLRLVLRYVSLGSGTNLLSL